MRLGVILAGVALSVGLAGCFTADKPLLTEANSVAPYAKITFREQHANETTTMIRAGTAYTSPSSDGPITTRFMATDRPNWYVAEVSGPTDPGGPKVLYGIVRVDIANKRADAFKTVGDAKDVKPGLRSCNDIICIDDLKAYIASAEAYADGGAAPDATYDISVE